MTTRRLAVTDAAAETGSSNNVLREGPPESVGMDPSRVARLRELLEKWVRDGDTTSVVALVARRGVIVLHEAFGVRRHDDVPAPTLQLNSIFPVASCAKPITAAAVMCLVDDGLIGLNRAFIDYVPELDVSGVEGLADAKVADLLCHTAGFDDLDLIAFAAATERQSPQLPPPSPGQHAWVNRSIHLRAGAALRYRPGSVSAYSNFGYMLLGDIVRRVSKQPFWRFVRSRLFEPLGMDDSYFKLPSNLRERRVFRAAGMPGTESVPWLPGNIDSEEFDGLDIAANGLATTARDLAVFAQTLLNGGSYAGKRVLSAASVAAMTRSQTDRSIRCIIPVIDAQTGKRGERVMAFGGYGFGLAIFGEGDRYLKTGSLASLPSFGHGGFGGACFWADPVQEIVGVYVSVSPRYKRGVDTSQSDLFQNAVHAAIVD